VDAAIRQVKVKPISMRISPSWTNLLGQKYDGIIHKVVRIKTALSGQSIDEVKTFHSPCYCQHNLFHANLLSQLFWHIFTGGAAFRRLLQCKDKSTLFTRHNGVEVVRPMSSRNGSRS
jgi:hypothetical protein